MPIMKLGRPLTIRSKQTGHIIRFTAENEFTTFVPPILMSAVAAYGAEVIEEDKKTTQKKQKASGDNDREKAIIEAIELMIARNDRGDWTASGLPTKKGVWDLVKAFEPDVKEIRKCFEKIKAAESNAVDVSVTQVQKGDNPPVADVNI
ncbi:MAG: hypothetical protein GTN99_08060 [Candidatus Dadabacteria bacterium]|nr:hypothetical protein [Candidatus Dadabacteria bacterium]